MGKYSAFSLLHKSRAGNFKQGLFPHFHSSILRRLRRRESLTIDKVSIKRQQKHTNVRKTVSNTSLEILLRLAWRIPAVCRIASSQPTVLLYHGTPGRGFSHDINGATFEAHIRLLKKHFTIVDPSNGLAVHNPASGRAGVCLTFDDGFRNNAEIAAPILERHNIPAMFFISCRHTAEGKYLWFQYLKALRHFFPEEHLTFRGENYDFKESAREKSIELLRKRLVTLMPHPSAMYKAIENGLPTLESFMSKEEINDYCAGITIEQIRQMANNPLFTFGVHTVDHPWLSKCSSLEIERQISENKRFLDQVLPSPCDTIAYPIGDYNREIIEICKRLALRRGFAVAPVLGEYEDFEIPRIGVYSASLNKLGFKVQCGKWIRKLNLRVG